MHRLSSARTPTSGTVKSTDAVPTTSRFSRPASAARNSSLRGVDDTSNAMLSRPR